MNAGFCQFAAILACGPCTLLDGGYSLFYEKNGEGHLIEGIEDFKPYYLESGEKHSLTGASELVAKPNQSVSPSDFLYPSITRLKRSHRSRIGSTSPCSTG